MSTQGNLNVSPKKNSQEDEGIVQQVTETAQVAAATMFGTSGRSNTPDTDTIDNNSSKPPSIKEDTHGITSTGDHSHDTKSLDKDDSQGLSSVPSTQVLSTVDSHSTLPTTTEPFEVDQDEEEAAIASAANSSFCSTTSVHGSINDDQDNKSIHIDSGDAATGAIMREELEDEATSILKLVTGNNDDDKKSSDDSASIHSIDNKDKKETKPTVVNVSSPTDNENKKEPISTFVDKTV